ncbi:hypothetical protein ACT17_14530 [Mycolicibacterium conceptionense]|uniref:Uncharacterized protein n=2 Tax=Mycolicibacterium TaxID=1866885 RepID=A0ABR5FWY4_9MYCO|nr:hypothetical protein AA982_17575 [Mycolicibacterium senegalense]KLO52477.1 hypothetical protein ABW05_14095 [Mycolicibacterium senegalense]KMV17843.1 hypothetical protein ACT17_14530 [Mycolicibacterium conceptionense]
MPAGVGGEESRARVVSRRAAGGRRGGCAQLHRRRGVSDQSRHARIEFKQVVQSDQREVTPDGGR